MRLNDKVAVVTGAGRGLGKAIAAKMAQEGASVAIVDVNYENCCSVQAEILEQGGRALAIACDVTKREAVVSMTMEVVKNYGRVDILVNNAGITRDALITELTDEQWDAVMNVNLKSMFICIQNVVKVMIPHSKGKIVNIASIAGEMGNPGQTNYAASKAGVIGMTKSLAKELARKNICVNAVAPGFIDSEMTQAVPDKVKEFFVKQIPLGRMGKPSEIAAACAFLSSDEADYITGHVLRVNGGRYL